MNRFRNWRIGLLGAVVSLLAIYFVVRQLDPVELTRAFSAARYEYVLICGVLLAVGLYTRALRWRVLLDGGLPIWRAFHILNISYLVNGILPLRIGEVGRIFLATRADPPVPAGQSTSTIIVERLLDLLAVVGLIALVLMSGPLPEELRAAAAFFGPAALLGFIALIVIVGQQERVLKITARIPILTRWNLLPIIESFLAGLAPLTRPAALLGALAWTAVSWGLSVAAGYILMFAFYDTASWLATALFISAAALAIAVPAVPGNFGPYEAAIVFALTTMGYAQDSRAIAFAVVVHGINLIIYAILGVIGFLEEGISLAQLSQGVAEMQQSNARSG